jgi:hypothetical protein
MKYLKHFYVDPITGEAFENGGSGSNGKTHPAIPGLDVRFWFVDSNGVDYCLSTIDDETSIAGFNGVTELTETAFFDDVEFMFSVAKEKRMLDLYELVKGIKAKIVDIWWHPSEISAAVSVKVAEANLAVLAEDEEAAALVAPIIALEANARGMTVIELAQRILTNYQGLISSEAVVSGHRGYVSDLVSAIPFDRTDVPSALSSFGDLGNFNITVGFDAVLAQLGIDMSVEVENNLPGNF